MSTGSPSSSQRRGSRRPPTPVGLENAFRNMNIDTTPTQGIQSPPRVQQQQPMPTNSQETVQLPPPPPPSSRPRSAVPPSVRSAREARRSARSALRNVQTVSPPRYNLPTAVKRQQANSATVSRGNYSNSNSGNEVTSRPKKSAKRGKLFGGGSTPKTKTNETVKVGSHTRIVYTGTHGAKYIRQNGKFVSIKTLKTSN